jgi:hypothetical protein
MNAPYEPGPNEVATALENVDRLLASINGDLSRMPDHKRNTRFHADRVKERRRLLAQREFLLARKGELALMN